MERIRVICGRQTGLLAAARCCLYSRQHGHDDRAPEIGVGTANGSSRDVRLGQSCEGSDRKHANLIADAHSQRRPGTYVDCPTTLVGRSHPQALPRRMGDLWGRILCRSEGRPREKMLTAGGLYDAPR